MARFATTISIGVVLSTLAVSAADAYAQRAPDLATLDRGDGITKIGADLALSLIDGPYSAGLRFEPYGQYVTRFGLGIYGAFPITRSFGGSDAPGSPDTTFAIGDLDLGALYVIENSPDISWVFRGGIGFPIASDSADGALTNALSTLPRLTDIALTVPDAFYVRLSVSPLIHIRRFYLRADLGIDIGSDDADRANELIRFNAGGGFDFGLIALGVELVNLWTLDDFGADEKFLHTLTGTVRFMGEKLQPFVAVGAPLDSSRRDAVSFYVAAGIQFVPEQD
jgi:hypothetical protein